MHDKTRRQRPNSGSNFVDRDAHHECATAGGYHVSTSVAHAFDNILGNDGSDYEDLCMYWAINGQQQVEHPLSVPRVASYA
jgi:hypothetical protein